MPFTHGLGCGGSTRGCDTTGEWSPAGGKGIYLPCSVQPGSYSPLTSILPGFLGIPTTPVDSLVKDLSPVPVVVPAGSSPVTLPLSFYF